MVGYPRLPDKPEFSKYNDLLTDYYCTQSEISKLQKENRDRMKQIRELYPKYFGTFGLTDKAKQVLKQYGIKSYGGVKI